MLIALYILMGISILAPIYTYAIYPLILRLFHSKVYSTNNTYEPIVSVVIVGGNEKELVRKSNSIRESDYGYIKEIIHLQTNDDVLGIIKQSSGDVVVVTDASSVFLKNSISEAIKALSEPQVGCVSGMVRKQPDENGNEQDGANWKYENRIKLLESNIGCLSGANAAFYVVRRELLPEENRTKINLDFMIPMSVTEKGFDVVFVPNALAYEVEKRSEKDLFNKHVADGASGYKSIFRFWRMLFPCKGSFVFWSHRVMKWLVPFNIIILLVGCGVLSFNQNWALVAFALQIISYFYLTLYYLLYTKKGKSIVGPIGKLSDFASYFLVLNVAWFLGLIVKK